MSTTPFFIPDTSPLFAYSCPDCSTSNATASGGNGNTTSASWLAAYRPRGDGYDQTFHETGDQGAEVALNVTASSLTFLTSPGISCPAQYSLNGSAWADACNAGEATTSGFELGDLPGGLHSLKVRPGRGVGDGGLEWMGVGGEVRIESGGSTSNLTLDDTSPSFILSPSNAWTTLPSRSSSSPSNATLATMYSDTSPFYNGTLAMTTSQDARMDITFRGLGIYVYGLSGTEGGAAVVRLDGEVQAALNMSNTWNTYSSLLYMGSGFSPNDTHTLSFVNTTPGKQLVIDYALLTTAQSSSASSSTNHLALIIGVITGISALLLALGVSSYILYTRRKTQRNASSRNRTPYAFAGGIGPGGAGAYGSMASSIDVWRKGAGSGSGSGSGSPATPSTVFGTGSVGFGAGLERDPRLGGGAGGVMSPTPEYPDYLPYRGPVEPPPRSARSAHSAREASEFLYPRPAVLPYDGLARTATGTSGSTRSGRSSPPLIAGANASASGWLHASRQAAATAAAGAGVGGWAGGVTSPSPSYSSSGRSGSGRSGWSGSRSGRSPLERPSPTAVRGWDRERERDERERGRQLEFDEIALDSYYQQPGVGSPPPFQLMDRGDESERGGRGEPASPGSVSTPSTLGLSGVPTRGVVASRSVARLWPSRDAVPSTFRTPSMFPASQSTSALTPTPAPAHPGSSSLQLNPATSTIDLLPTSRSAPSPLPTSSGSPSLRRGVSIKSVKTMRSFFSGLIFVPPSSTSPVPSTPALLPQTAARPDSGIFPLGGGFSRGPSRYGANGGRSGGGGSGGGSVGRGITPLNTSISGRSPGALGLGTNIAPVAGPSAWRGSVTGRRDDRDHERNRDHEQHGEGEGDETSPNFFIELDPNSPITASRPGSAWTRYKSGASGFAGFSESWEG
ncbi:hypothetical protein IAT38_005483 [Cryptococcus sp. DSM 104549]